MQPKPEHLAHRYGAQFMDGSVAAAYRHRPPSPAETFQILSRLIPLSGPRTVLDAGCGTGFVARPLAALVERVDAIDFSEAMISEGKSLPGGDAANLRWVVGPLETVPLDLPYGLVAAGNSVHWMDWAVVFPRFREALTAGGYVALVEERTSPSPWRDALQPIINSYSTNRDYAPYELIGELRQRGHLQIVSVQETAPMPLVQSVE